MFEHRKQPLLSRVKFFVRVLYAFFVSGFILALSLGLGILGYHIFCGLGWLDSLLNSSMILTGMGEIDPIKSDAGKWFASIYALYSGVAFLSMVSVLVAPFLHRLLHFLHAEAAEK